MDVLTNLPDFDLGGGYAAQVKVDSDLTLPGSSVTLLIYDGDDKKLEEDFAGTVVSTTATYDVLIAAADIPDTAKEYDYWLWLNLTGTATPLLLESGKIECKNAKAPSA